MDSKQIGLDAGAIDSIAGLAKRERARFETIAISDRKFILDHVSGEQREIFPAFEDTAPHSHPAKVGTLAALLAWAQSWGFEADNGPHGEVRVSRTATTEAFTPRMIAPHEKRETASKDFYSRFMPPSTWLDFEQLRAWLDMVWSGIDPDAQDVLDVCLGTVTGTDETLVEMKIDGGAITARVKNNQGVSTSRQVPRRIKVVMPFGDPDFRTAVSFILTAKANAGVPSFSLRHDLLDGAHDRYLAWATSAAKTVLGDAWLVLDTP